MKKWMWKTFGVIAILSVVTLVSKVSDQQWIAVFYATILGLFTPEIRGMFKKRPRKRIRLSYSYLYRIQFGGRYLLVRDGQGRNQYQPVGGVYKYDSEHVDLEDLFEGIPDGVFGTTPNLSDDLRIIISTKKLEKFNEWFSSNEGRENIFDLGREFREELVDNGILDRELFKTIKYKYVGSLAQESFNDTLRIDQIRHFDIVTLKPANAQRTYFMDMNSRESYDYIFATKEEIESGYAHRSGRRCPIAEHAKLILVEQTESLTKESRCVEYSVQIVKDNGD